MGHSDKKFIEEYNKAETNKIKFKKLSKTNETVE